MAGLHVDKWYQVDAGAGSGFLVVVRLLRLALGLFGARAARPHSGWSYERTARRGGASGNRQTRVRRRRQPLALGRISEPRESNGGRAGTAARHGGGATYARLLSERDSYEANVQRCSAYHMRKRHGTVIGRGGLEPTIW